MSGDPDPRRSRFRSALGGVRRRSRRDGPVCIRVRQQGAPSPTYGGLPRAGREALRRARSGIHTDELRTLARRSREVMLLAALTGALTGAFVRFFDFVVAERMLEAVLEADWRWGIVAPAAGLTLSALALRTIGGGATSATSDDYIRAFHDSDFPLRVRELVGKITAAIATLGTGGAMGLEGPSIYGGASLGANIQRRLPAPLRGADFRTLMTAGAAAGVAAIFKAPATGAIFVLEVPFRDQLARRMLLPALVASGSGYITFVALSNTNPIFSISEPLTSTFRFVDLIGAITIGLGCAVGARLFARLMRAAKRFTVRPIALRLVVAGCTLALLFLLTRLVTADGWNPADGESLTLGPGYQVVRWLADERALWLLAAIFLFRMGATAATVAGGGAGGVFIPLVVGGAIVGRAVSEVFSGVDPQLYVLLGIAAFLGAGYRVPLASVMFVAETTGRPGFIVPALFAAVAGDLMMGDVSVTSFQREL